MKDHPPEPQLQVRTCRTLLAAIVVLAIALRLAAAFVLQQPLESDALSYFTMAQGLAERGELRDVYGQHAFYSAGYPLLLTPFFMLLGSSVSVALMVNVILAAISAWLAYRLALALSASREAGLLAATLYALWFPAIWNASMVAKENLSTPLLLALTLCAVWIERGHRPLAVALAAGLLWGAALVTGGSSLLLCAGIGLALILLWRAQRRFSTAFTAGLCFVAGALLALAPWLHATSQMVGRPVLTTNGAFNLYLGNNPAATGRFVSIADTPMGQDWDETRARLGEVGTADRLQRDALRWIADNPAMAGELAIRKLAYFWLPNIPDAQDFATSKAVAALRLVEVIQYALILLFGLSAFGSRLVSTDGKWIIAAMIAGFWLIHAAAYIIVRYRDPAIPLLIVMASVLISGWLRQLGPRRLAPHAA